MKNTSWNFVGTACYGALIGMLAVIAHETYEALSDEIPETDPFIHVMGEMIIFGIGGAILFTVGAKLWLSSKND
ncbi:hypothetical protein [Microvirga rosea]|uniref:hypothetical protein n=1 Tax=Microvirga rosea TaxID=2715425 RepID=UPI001D0A1044|nr:hypothetical protein [Microvirga rosea]MCB8820763.1 hypothetical protein [Microvirga rosea]